MYINTPDIQSDNNSFTEIFHKIPLLLYFSSQGSSIKSTCYSPTYKDCPPNPLTSIAQPFFTRISHKVPLQYSITNCCSFPKKSSHNFTSWGYLASRNYWRLRGWILLESLAREWARFCLRALIARLSAWSLLKVLSIVHRTFSSVLSLTVHWTFPSNPNFWPILMF